MPSDERYASVDRQGDRRSRSPAAAIPIVADEHADPELGSGAVKITPGHDFNDFEVGKRAGIQGRARCSTCSMPRRAVVQTADGLIPDEFLGLDRFDAREAGGRAHRRQRASSLACRQGRSRSTTSNRARSDPVRRPRRRGDRAVADRPVVRRCREAGQPPMQAVRDGRIEIVPKTWEKTFFNWMENIQPWCVSAASCGGGTGFRRGMGRRRRQRSTSSETRAEALGARADDEGANAARLRTSSTTIHPPRTGRSPRWLARRRIVSDARSQLSATTTSSTPGSPPRCGPSPRSAGRDAAPGASARHATTPTTC